MIDIYLQPIHQIIAFFLFLIISAEIDVYLIVKKKKSPDHKINAFIRFAGCAVIARDWQLIPLLLSSWWLLFDLYLNLRRKLPLLYIGKTAELDKLLHKLPVNQLVVKGLCILISVFFFLITK